MTTPAAQAARRLPAINDLVSSDFNALASHMDDCNRSRGRFFALRSNLETLHGAATLRIVTTGTLLVICSLGLLAFA